MLPSNASHPTPKPAVPYSEHHVEYPTFSVLPPLESLTVLEIDELAYLDEMALLIERSKDRLQELRVGISAKAMHKDFVQTWDGSGLRADRSQGPLARREHHRRATPRRRPRRARREDLRYQEA